MSAARAQKSGAVPLYTVAEAARVVRINPATLRSWVLGRSYPTRSGDNAWNPLSRVADRKECRLSFANWWRFMF